MSEPIGYTLAQRLTAALCLNGIPYQQLVDIIYSELSDIGNELELGDWLQLPNGTTFTCTYKPNK